MSEYKWTREEFQALVVNLEETPGKVRRLVESLGEGEKVWKPVANEFSAIENVCHLRDIEEEGYCVRIQRLMEETEPYLNDLDGARLARERDYNSQNMNEALERFTQARGRNVTTVRSLQLEGLNRRGTFEGTGAVTLGQLLLMMREHDEAHIRELENLRAHLSGD
ncbi:MAG: DinB family protein [Pyrinomonadaceae bacterium]|nr:DinB family protein [Pyrinomonadaceae bacterium]